MPHTEGPTSPVGGWIARRTATGYFVLATVFFVWAFIWLAWAPKPYAWIATVLWILIAVVFAEFGRRLRKKAPADDEEAGGGEPGDGGDGHR